MIRRPDYLSKLREAVRRSPVVAILGPRQCGKTTLARMFGSGGETTYFDLESLPDQQRLSNPELALADSTGLVVLDEIQHMPELFNALRVLVDRTGNRARFLVPGSASPHIVRNVSETLAGRVEFLELSGFGLAEIGPQSWRDLWLRGGFPRAFLAANDPDSVAWREGFIRTFLERDIPQLGISIPAVAMRRFWTMLAHHHGQTWNASELGRAMGLTDKTVRSYLDLLSGTFMVRQLPPWHENIGKRQVKSPKVYLRDSGIMHSLLGLPDLPALLSHPRVGASWEGFALDQLLQVVQPNDPHFWATHSGAELDLLFTHRGRRYGVEFKFSEAPSSTRSMRIAQADLGLEHLWIVYPGQHVFPLDRTLTAIPVSKLDQIRDQLGLAR